MQETLVRGIVKIKWDKVYKPYSKDSMSKGYDEFGGGDFIIYLFWLCCEACVISVPWPGIEPAPPAVDVRES